MIRVLLVDDSPVAVAVLRKMLAGAPNIEVVGAASNGEEALALVTKLRPKVVLTDFHMPRMDGLALTRELMAHHPVPILVVSVSVLDGSDNAFHLLEAGAVDIFPKPRGGLDGLDPVKCQELIRKVKVLAGVVPVRRHRRTAPVAPAVASVTPVGTSCRLVALGASTGGPQALVTILGGLPAELRAPVVCVQHISEGFLADMVSWLQGHTPLSVAVAAAGEEPKAGWVYFPPEGQHLMLDGHGRFQVASAVPAEYGAVGDGHRPSVDALFLSLARHLGKETLAVLLTGMGQDGARGLLAIHQAGGRTIAQDEESCVVFGMPARAIELGGARQVLPLERIAPEVRRQVAG